MAAKNVAPEKGANIPGPGSYDPFRTSLAKQSTKIGNEKRLFDYESEIPGPGGNCPTIIQHTTYRDHSVLVLVHREQYLLAKTE